ncbi:MAG: DUF1674 domain-containing protein [Woeseiaceae bacterium]|nr:DUF1674 domain-containing protein [Woeseiaceae bacterium]
MSVADPRSRPEDAAEEPRDDDREDTEQAPRPREVGGRGGLDPTRYGDWEKAGRCIDF